MPVGSRHARRVRLTGQTMDIRFLDARGCEYTYSVTIDRELGEGTSGICYEATVFKSRNGIGQKRILKQFYPDSGIYKIEAEIDGINLNIKDFWQNGAVRRLAELFEEAYRDQVELSNRGELAGVIVRPDLCHFDGPTKYILYEPDHGEHLRRDRIGSLRELIRTFYRFAAALEKLHRQRILHMDLKPENVLVTGDQRIKFFDFDASIDMDRIADIHLENIRCDENRGLLAPELRLGNRQEFEQNKRDFLNERVDIYSFGAILFSFLLERYPEPEDCRGRAYEEEIRSLYGGKYRGELTQKEADRLNHIIWKCIRSDLSARGRYRTTRELVSDLEELWNAVNAPVGDRRREFQVVNGRLQAAYVMDKYPLSRFRRRDKNGGWRMDVLIAGDDPVGDDFFVNIYACAQMLDTKIVLRLASREAEKRMDGLLGRWRLLRKTTELYLNETPAEAGPDFRRTELDLSITKTPFAEVWFYDWDSESRKISELYGGMREHSQISWVILADARTGENMRHARELEGAVSAQKNPVFIGYLDERGDGFDLRRLEPEHENITLCPFSCNDKYSLEESEFTEGIRRQALLLHRHYMREWNERADTREIWKDFSSSSYNVNSSLCSVLSIPYKLESIGIRTAGTEAAAEFYYDVLSGTERADQLLNKLIYLEHRRWMCFLVTEGYDKPAMEQVAQYAFRGKNDQRKRDGEEKLHPLICDSDPEGGVRLHELSHREWEMPDFQEAARRKGRPFDELDCMSVRLHQLCSKRAARLSLDEGELRDIFSALERNMRDEKFGEEGAEALEALKTACRRMLDNESNVNHLWDRMCREFELVLRAHDKKAKLHGHGVTDAFKNLKNTMRVVAERNKYHDYKSSDRTILEAIPLLLLSTDPIRRIHKPVGGQSWHNVVSSLIMEPEELILYTGQPEEAEREALETFLREERGLRTAVRICGMDALYGLKMKKSSVKSVLDVTGLSAMETFELARQENLASIPVVAFKDGQLRGLGGRSEADYYSRLRRHLTVRETFRLFRSDTCSGEGRNPVLGLSANCEELWRAYRGTDPLCWNETAEVLSQLEKENAWRIDPENVLEVPVTKTFRQVPRALVLDAGMDKVLEELRSRELIGEGYRLPDTGQVGTVTVRTKFGDVSEYMDRMFYLARKHSYVHKFRFAEQSREPSGQSMYYICDDTLAVDKDLEEELKDGRQRSDMLREALSRLYDQKSADGESGVLELLDGKPMVEKRMVQGKPGFHLQFVYRNRAAKECLMGAENILKAYTYHSIWNGAFVDDIRLNPADAGAADVVCTKNMQTYFISCRQTMPGKEYLRELRFLADYFGIDGKAILITGGRAEGNGPQESGTAGTIGSEGMKVFHITGEMLGAPGEENSGRLAGYIQNIIDGKRDWTVLG